MPKYQERRRSGPHERRSDASTSIGPQIPLRILRTSEPLGKRHARRAAFQVAARPRSATSLHETSYSTHGNLARFSEDSDVLPKLTFGSTDDWGYNMVDRLRKEPSGLSWILWKGTGEGLRLCQQFGRVILICTSLCFTRMKDIMRRVFTYTRVLQACVPLVAVLFGAVPNSLQASIILLERSPFDSGQVIFVLDGASSLDIAGRCSTMVPSDEMPTNNPPAEPVSPSRLLFMLSLAGTSASSRGGSSSGASKTSGTSQCPMGATAVSARCAPDFVHWVSGERRLAFPAPPGTELLRPPQ